MLGKNPSRSMLTTTARPAWARALDTTLRPGRNPWAGASAGSLLTTCSKTQRWAADRVRCGALSVLVVTPYLYRQLLPPWIINFPTKENWRAVSRLDAIVSGLEYLAAHIAGWGVESLAVPPLGLLSGGAVAPRCSVQFCPRSSIVIVAVPLEEAMATLLTPAAGRIVSTFVGDVPNPLGILIGYVSPDPV